MERLLSTAAERAMKVQEVILKAMAKLITWWQAAEILGIHVRTMRRWRARYERSGYDGLVDRRKGRPSEKRVPMETVEKVLMLYRTTYFDFNVRHFHEKLREEHDIELSYTWVKKALQGAGLVKAAPRREKHRKRRPRRPLPGMMLHIDGSTHRWFQAGRSWDLIVILDDATSEIYYARLVDQESTRTVMAALRHVVELQGWFCSLYSDRASHFFETPKAGGKVNLDHVTQLGRALRDLGIQMIPSYAPQGRGRSERNFRTWQGRLPQELRLRSIDTVEEANRFLEATYIEEFNRKFKVPPAQTGTAFSAIQRQDLDRVFSIHHDRIVNDDNTVEFDKKVLQIEPTPVRSTLAGCRVLVYEHLDGTLSIGFGPHTVGRYNAQGAAIPTSAASTSARTGKTTAKSGGTAHRPAPRMWPINDPRPKNSHHRKAKPKTMLRRKPTSGRSLAAR
jgi:transposase